MHNQRLYNKMLSWAAIISLVLGCSGAQADVSPAGKEVLLVARAEQVKVLDGDTLAMGPVRVRMQGIDAPEKAQLCMDAKGAPWECGVVSREQLQARIGRGKVRCQLIERDKYGRAIGECYAGRRKESLNAMMVREGMAVAYIKYTDRYAGLEARARDAGKGIWAGAFLPPEQWRREHKK